MKNSVDKPRKLQPINKCSECNNCVFDGEKKEHWGKYWCWTIDKEVNPDSIDNECPLDDYDIYERPLSRMPENRPVSVYILYSSRGQYEDYEECIEGVFSTTEKAKDYMKLLEDGIERDKNLECPVKDFWKRFDSLDNDLTDDEMKAYWEWSSIVDSANDHNRFWIVKFEVDKINSDE